tara:strand:+ start:123 stop:557 length:435 start_codon:yes stop_codon:yes gene_type:complete
MITIYTDGSCLGNPGPGGWGAICEPLFSISGGEANTTNNIMEMTAVIKALEACRIHGATRALIYTDSKYVKLGLTEWSNKWIANGWKTAAGGEVKNKNLWVRLIQLMNDMNEVQVEWVKAHSTNVMNNRVDELARDAARLFSTK